MNETTLKNIEKNRNTEKQLDCYQRRQDYLDANRMLPHRLVDTFPVFAPWHQEAGYYLPKGNCCPQSVVLSTYLHDCDQSGGALEVATETEPDVLDHDQRYMDPVSKRFMRVEVGAPEATRFAETRFGETVIFDFLRRHRSGVNSKDTVRITFLLRASRQTDVEDYARKAAS
ncbi:hypothetical protein JM93_01850 [Roseibium hamelinense]|uniref:Phytanoyl-CoA dioxygenase PhyH n=1 Tax=Roseibium hamelinense TaxID=150831 RepID=A0A562T7Q6_9HYPH|nr:hypothetical protein [Roseibium hamelinense]MTI43561.1 hypothetical protein [Roseibium hamelinense]TWI89645.1 hypothetical protein JM93_01850 [Roseibium hamelinense]